MNFNPGVRLIQLSTETVGNVVSATDTDVTFRTPEGVETTCAKDDCKTLKGRPRKMAV